MKNAVAKIIVVILFSKSDSAVNSIVNRLVNCSVSNSFAFMALSL